MIDSDSSTSMTFGQTLSEMIFFIKNLCLTEKTQVEKNFEKF